MRRLHRALAAPLALAALVALPACSSSRPAAPAAAETARDDGAGMTATGGGVRMRMGEGGPGGEMRGMTPEQRADRRLATLDAALTLTVEQKARLRPILLAEILDMPRMRREELQDMDQTQMRQMAARMQERRDRVNRIIEGHLTPEQVTRFRAYLQQERDRMMQQVRQRPRDGGGP